jgi:hypothetical protein
MEMNDPDEWMEMNDPDEWMEMNDPNEWMEMNDPDQGGREEGRQSLQALLGRRCLCSIFIT